MPHISHASRKRIFLFAAGLLLALFLNILSQLVDGLQYSSSVLYSALLMAWAVTIRRRLADGAILGAYIKRRANLELLADREPTLSTEELAYAVRESFE